MSQQISALSTQAKYPAGKLTAVSPRSSQFAELLSQNLAAGSTQPARGDSGDTTLLVGEISTKHQTVSELLMANKELRSATWDILSSESNRNREYTSLQPGTRIYYDKMSGKLSWAEAMDAETRSPKASISTPGAATSAYEETVAQPLPTSQQHAMIKLGRLSDNHPTVSHLLHAHPELAEKTWEILADPSNHGKSFDQIAGGKDIYFNPQTQEITWQHQRYSQPAETADMAVATTQTDSSQPTLPAADLSEAVQPLFGTAYKDLNCYELLVKGLQRMDIAYGGKNGLFGKLTGMARDKGMPANAYLNGEGIVKAAGTEVFGKSYQSMANWRQEAKSLLKELEPVLDKGQILSFSTENRGHTGIISRQDNQWTYINSGRLDNSITANSLHRGVGEEHLHKEINNWFKLAHARNETLTITLGSLAQPEFQTAYRQNSNLHATRI